MSNPLLTCEIRVTINHIAWFFGSVRVTGIDAVSLFKIGNPHFAFLLFSVFSIGFFSCIYRHVSIFAFARSLNNHNISFLRPVSRRWISDTFRNTRLSMKPDSFIFKR